MNRLAVAAVAAAIVLGGTTATIAEPDSTPPSGTQTVTITVTSAPRTITAVGAPELAVQTGGEATDATDLSALQFENPAGNADAKITVSRDSTDIGGLTIAIFAVKTVINGCLPTGEEFTGSPTDTGDPCTYGGPAEGDRGADDPE